VQSCLLGNDNIREFRTPDFLLLRCQLTLKGLEVLIEPLLDRPTQAASDQDASDLGDDIMHLDARAREIAPSLERLLGSLRAVEQEMRVATTLTAYRTVERYETWRAEAGDFLEQMLPGSGARELVLPTEGVIGQGPLRYEYSRITTSIAGMTELIKNVRNYILQSPR
jgi:hypothetical protein